jgi:hypothetical protein
MRYQIERDKDGLPVRMHWLGPYVAVADREDDLTAWERWHAKPWCDPDAVWFRNGKASSSRAEMAQPDTQECE